MTWSGGADEASASLVAVRSDVLNLRLAMRRKAGRMATLLGVIGLRGGASRPMVLYGDPTTRPPSAPLSGMAVVAAPQPELHDRRAGSLAALAVTTRPAGASQV